MVLRSNTSKPEIIRSFKFKIISPGWNGGSVSIMAAFSEFVMIGDSRRVLARLGRYFEPALHVCGEIIANDPFFYALSQLS